MNKRKSKRELREEFVAELGLAVLDELKRPHSKTYREYRHQLSHPVEVAVWSVASRFEAKFENAGIGIHDVVYGVSDAIVNAMCPPPRRKRKRKSK